MTKLGLFDDDHFDQIVPLSQRPNSKTSHNFQGKNMNITINSKYKKIKIRILCQFYTGINCEFPEMIDEKDRIFTDFYTGDFYCKDIEDCDCRT